MKFWEKFFQGSICLLATGAFLLLPMTVEAAAKPQVNWAPNVFCAGEVTPASLVAVPGVSDEIAKTLTERLEQLDSQGKLPFVLNKQGTGSLDAHELSDDSLSIQPFAVLDTSLDSKMTIDGNTVYKSIVLSGLDVAVAIRDSETHQYRMLGMIPLNTYTKLEGTTPFTLEQKAQAYSAITQNMIREQLDFSKNKKLFQHLEERSVGPSDDLWQVSDVAVGSKKAQEIYGDQTDKLRRIVASFFASNYQQATGRTVLPSALETGYYSKDAKANSRAFSLNSPLESATMVVPEAENKIVLDVCGVNSAVMDEDKSDVKRHVVYRAWLRGRPANDQPGAATEKTVDRIGMEAEYKTGNVSVKNSLVNTYTLLYLDLSSDLGQVMGGKKPKKK